ncbi:TPA: hypothetical protein DCW54_01335 [Candidatus Dependentiae bacterium]|nr:hypothetical protein [Candidatus Dependentiae bacterium]
MIRKTIAFFFAINAGLCFAQTSIKNPFELIAPIVLNEYIQPQKQETTEAHEINLQGLGSGAQEVKKAEEAVNLNLTPLEEEEVVKTYISLFPQIIDSHIVHNIIGHEDFCSLQDLQKLNVLSGTASDKTHSLKHIFPTKTQAGAICKTLILGHPTSNKKTLLQRQQEIRFFLKHPEIRVKLQEQLDVIAKNERIFLNYFKAFSPIEERELNSYYFNAKFLKPINKSPKTLEAYHLSIRALTMLGFVPVQIWQRLSTEIARTYQETGSFPQIFTHLPEIMHNTCKKGFLDLLHQHNPRTNGLKKIESTDGRAFSIAATGKEHTSWGDIALGAEYQLTEGHTPSNQIKRVGIRALSQLFGIIPAAYLDAGTAQLAYQTIQENKRFASILKNFHTKLHATAKIVQAYREIYTLIEGSPLQHDGLLEEFMLFRDNSFNQMVETLEQNKWINRPFSFISNWGQILATNQQLETYKAQIAQPLYEIGLLDTIAATATVIDQTTASSLPISFASYENSEQPSLVALKFWNPLVTTHKAVLNSIELLPEKAHGLLFTGPNGSGKSTNTKGIIFNIILSQTLGIAFAQEFKIAPYTKLFAAFNEQEDVAQDLSSFMAEKMRIDALCRTIEKLRPDERVFVFMDEAVKGTVEEAAGEIILDTCLKLAKQPQAHALVITHTQAPTQAEQLTNGIFKNYFVEVLEPRINEFIRTFVLKEGAAQWWFSSPETRKAFIKFLSNEEEMKIAAA